MYTDTRILKRLILVKIPQRCILKTIQHAMHVETYLLHQLLTAILTTIIKTILLEPKTVLRLPDCILGQ